MFWLQRLPLAAVSFAVLRPAFLDCLPPGIGLAFRLVLVQVQVQVQVLYFISRPLK